MNLDTAKFRNSSPNHAEGKFRIDLTDPITGKTKFRSEDKNHIFLDSIFTGQYTQWCPMISKAWVVLNNAGGRAVDPDFPYVPGVNVGYGRPSQGSLGLLRGAYNAATQILAQQSLQGVRWKFQYDFTVAQANGTPIDMIGVTGQYPDESSYSPGAGKTHMSGFLGLPPSVSYANHANDGRYAYDTSSSGIVTRRDLWLGTSIAIDISSVVGTNTNNSKYTGYAPATGRYYVYVFSNTPSQRILYEFSDNMFSNLLASYPLSNHGSPTGAFYVHGGNMYGLSNSYSIIKVNYINNIAPVNLGFSQNYSRASYNESTFNGQPPNWTYGHMAHGKYLYLNAGGGGNSGRYGAVFDLTTEEIISNHSPAYDTQYHTGCLHPLTAHTLPCSLMSGGVMTNCCAIAAKKLDVPVLKTSANGMTVTYEIEVTY